MAKFGIGVKVRIGAAYDEVEMGKMSVIDRAETRKLKGDKYTNDLNTAITDTVSVLLGLDAYKAKRAKRVARKQQDRYEREDRMYA